MEKQKQVWLYGNSVILGTIGASLRRTRQFEVNTLPLSLPAGPEMEALKPDVVFFDLEAEHPDAIFSLLKGHPGLLLIGVSPDSNLVKVWSERQFRELSTCDLLEVINENK